PSLTTAASSAAVVSTQLWPMDAFGSLPTCFRVTVKSAQLAGTSIVLRSNCSMSLPSIVTAQSAAQDDALNRPSASRARILYTAELLSWGIMDHMGPLSRGRKAD